VQNNSVAVYGEEPTVTAYVTPGDIAGQVQFSVDGYDVGDPVDVVHGSATSPALLDEDGKPLAVGIDGHDVAATFTPTDAADYTTASGDTTQTIAPAGTTTTVAVGTSSITATVAPVAPGAGTPTGTVTFSLDGASIGDATLVDGVATLNHAVPAGAEHGVAAVYGGDVSFTGSSGSTARHDPAITAAVSSAHGKTNGWYRTPVVVTFTCTTNGAPLSTTCPKAVTLSRNGAGQMVTRTITAADGGAATVTVGPTNIDRTAPTVIVRGVKNGALYVGPAPKAGCAAQDRLSGLVACRVVERTSAAGRTTYHVVAVDRAGNVTRITGRFRSLTMFVEGVPYRHGRFVTHMGTAYVLGIYAKSRPRYYFTQPAGLAEGPPFQKGPLLKPQGNHLWTIRIHIRRDMGGTRLWNLGAKVRHVMRTVGISVRG
jgi:hypothetical protein